MLTINDFDYFLPKSFIAQKPASPRDHSKLLIYDTKKDKIYFDRFYNLDKFLPKNSFLVLNDTKVIPARVILYKRSGGKVEVLFLVNELNKSEILNPHFAKATRGEPKSQINSNFLNSNLKTSFKIRGYVDRKIEIGDKLCLDLFHCFKTMKQEGSIFTFELNFSIEKLLAILEKKGTMPIPLYIKNTPLNEDELRIKYQTIFARAPDGARQAGQPDGARFSVGSTAAPTASLHFTNRLFKKLDRQGIKKYFITLYIGLGTFAPITEKNIQEKKLHNEFYEISPKTFQYINTLKQNGKKLVAVGTTVTRTLESLAIQINQKTENRDQKTEDGRQNISNLSSDFGSSVVCSPTSLFIFPPYKFQMVDCLITNFHLPKSSLMMLVEAFLQFKKSKRSLIDLYQITMKNSFRFYSFGDAMMIK